MDALVAERVMGLPKAELGGACPKCGGETRIGVDRAWCFRCSEWIYSPYPEYSTDIAAAWRVVEHLIGKDGRDQDLFIECWADGEWFVAFHPMGYEHRDPKASCDGRKTGVPSAPLAICRAALKAIS